MEIITRVSYRQSVQLNSSELLRGTIKVFERGILVATLLAGPFVATKLFSFSPSVAYVDFMKTILK